VKLNKLNVIYKFDCVVYELTQLYMILYLFIFVYFCNFKFCICVHYNWYNFYFNI